MKITLSFFHSRMQIIHVKICTYLSERCVRLIASVEDSGLSGRGLNPGCGCCVVFQGKTHNLAVPLSTQVSTGSREFNRGI